MGNTAKLKYEIEPRSVYYTRDIKNPSVALLAISASNTGEEDIQIDGFEVSIPVSPNVTDPNALTADASSIIPVSADRRWDFNGSSGRYRAEPIGSAIKIKGGESLTFYLKNILVNDAAGTVLITITEKAGPDIATQDKQVVKMKSDLDINRFSANPVDSQPGETCTLSWTTTAAARVTLSPGEYPPLPTSGSVEVRPTYSTTYTLTAFGEGPNISALAHVNINPPGIIFNASSLLVNVGDTVTLTWQVTNARKVYISAFGERVFPLTGNIDLQITSTTSVTLRAVNIDGEKEKYESTITININPVKIVSFTKTDGYGSVELQWEIQSALSARIETVDGPQTGENGLVYNIPADKLAKGSYPVMVPPTTEKRFVLTAQNEKKSETAEIPVPIVPSGWKDFPQAKFPEYDITRATVLTTIKYKNKIHFFIKGEKGQGNKLYTSSDGISWDEQTANYGWSYRSSDASWCVFKNRLWMMAGTDWDANKVCNDVWSSEDGINWRLETPAAPWQARHSAGCFVLPGIDKLFIVGGFDRTGSPPEGIPFNDVWSTSDGKNWEKETDAAFNKGRYFFSTPVFDNKAWVICGFVGHPLEGGATLEIWNTADGKNWKQVKPQPGWLPKFYFRAAALHDGIYLAAVDIDLTVMKPVYTFQKVNKEGVFSNLPPHTMGDVRMFDELEYNGALWCMNIFTNDYAYHRDIKVYVP